MRGVAYTSWWHGEYSTAESDATLSQVVKPLGVNWTALVVTCYQQTVASTTIDCLTDSRTPTDADVMHFVAQAHSLGMKVMLKPHIDLLNDPTHWRGEIGFDANEMEWRAWFTSYTTFITHYAALAESAGVDYFAVGTELVGTSKRTADWRRVVKAVRGIYHGPLTYAANWGDEGNVQWWDAVDAIGIDAYYPLTQNTNPSGIQLAQAWQSTVAKLGNLSRREQRPVIFTEAGYQSRAGTAASPAGTQSATVDLQEQSRCYQALLDAFAGQPWWLGVFWWSVAPNRSQGGPSDTGFTPIGKPAADIVRAYFSGGP